MKHLDDCFAPRPHHSPDSLATLAKLGLAFLMILTLITPLQATQRMVLGEELTNNE